MKKIANFSLQYFPTINEVRFDGQILLELYSFIMQGEEGSIDYFQSINFELKYGKLKGY